MLRSARQGLNLGSSPIRKNKKTPSLRAPTRTCSMWDNEKVKRELIFGLLIKKPKQLSLSFRVVVRVMGLEPILSRTRPLNVRVCHSATPAYVLLKRDYNNKINKVCQQEYENFFQIKNFLLYFHFFLKF